MLRVKFFLSIFPFAMSACGLGVQQNSGCSEGQSRDGAICKEQNLDESKKCIDPNPAKILESTKFTMCDGSIVSGQMKICGQDGDAECLLGKSLQSLDIAKVDYSSVIPSIKVAGKNGELSLNAWDLRAGRQVDKVTGRLVRNCRNGGKLSVFDQSSVVKDASANNATEVFTVNNHGWSENTMVRLLCNACPTNTNYGVIYYLRNVTTNTFQLSLTSGGAVINITDNGSSVQVFQWGDGQVQLWDLIDDSQGFASEAVIGESSWISDLHICGGIEQSVGDKNIWKDVTLASDGSRESSCAATPSNCSLKDKVTLLEWQKSDLVSRNWTDSLAYCDQLSYNFKSDWRLPTQKELLDLLVHGIKSTSTYSGWMSETDLNNGYWASTTSGGGVVRYNAWIIDLSSTIISKSINKQLTRKAFCVRP